MKIAITVELVKGYRIPLELDERNELTIEVEAPNMATAQRMFKALTDKDNAKLYSIYVTEE